MAETASYDLIVIGGGPAGYVGAIRAAQLGMNVACVETDKLGGICLNWGCIPTKALLAGAAFYHKLKHDADDWGITADNVSHNWEKVISRSRGVAGNLNKGIGGLFRKNKIKHIEGHAKITRGSTDGKPAQVQVTGRDGNISHELQARHVLIATGARPRALPFAPFDGERIISSKEAMSLKEQPKKLVIIGAGPIGMEFAYFYNAFGTEVEVLEMQPNVLPNEDDEVSKVVDRSFKKQGITCRTSTKVTAVDSNDAGVEVTIGPLEGQGSEKIQADKVLVAIGVQGRFDGLFDPSLGLEIVRDHIKADRHQYATSVPGLYAVGDVIGPPWLAHVASEEAIACVEQLAGLKTHGVDYDAIPGCTYCHPQVASLGLTEFLCKERGHEYTVGKFPFAASGKAQAEGHTEGFVKIIRDKKYGEILGVHMVGENVTELIAELGLAKTLEATPEEIIATMHAHPTLSEAIHEAALGTDGRMIHF